MHKHFFFPLLLLLATAARAQQYEIRVTVEGVHDTSLYLGYSFEDKRYVVDTAQADAQGHAVFSRHKTLDKGVYFVALPDKTYFELLMPDKQSFAVSAKHGELYETLAFEGSPENEQFLEYQRYLHREQAAATAIRQRQKNNEAGLGDSVAIYQRMLTKTDSSITRYAHDLIARNSSNVLGVVQAALQEVELPAFDIPADVKNPDSVRQWRAYEYRLAHYFDGFKLTENTLIRTPFFKPRLEFFFSKMIAPAPDTIIRYADSLLARAQANSEMFRYLVEYLFQRYQTSEYMGHDAVVLHLADAYYLSGKAPWATEDYLKKIRDRADNMRHNLIGLVAPELLLQTHAGEYFSLHKMDADFVVLCFWEPNCGHCKKELPELWTMYQKLRDKGVKVLTVYTQYKKPEWDKFIADNAYDWLYAWDGVEAEDEHGKPTTYSLGNNFRQNYDVYSTPTLYLLDSDKKIIAKRMSVEMLEKILNEEMKRAKK
ncbi:MAG: redoxin domain-containing protein [Prevotellaceae bacterium]|jgi:thiol-disulfide isomerase/thioredoxin|nr:redoxin domain-containing protein [Prevotellaceae bacterium]